MDVVGHVFGIHLGVTERPFWNRYIANIISVSAEAGKFSAAFPIVTSSGSVGHTRKSEGASHKGR